MTKSDILSDLDYVKTLAEEGRNAPLLGGRFGLWWGGLSCVALFIHWLFAVGQIAAPVYFPGLLWFGFGVIGLTGSAVLEKTLAGKPGASATNNRLATALWTGNTILLFLFGLSAGVAAAFGMIDYKIMNIMLPLVFGLYGLTAYVMSKVTHISGQMLTGLIALGFVPLTLWLLESPHLFLVAIPGVIATVIIPESFNLMREPKDVV